MHKSLLVTGKNVIKLDHGVGTSRNVKIFFNKGWRGRELEEYILWRWWPDWQRWGQRVEEWWVCILWWRDMQKNDMCTVWWNVPQPRPCGIFTRHTWSCVLECFWMSAFAFANSIDAISFQYESKFFLAQIYSKGKGFSSNVFTCILWKEEIFWTLNRTVSPVCVTDAVFYCL